MKGTSRLRVYVNASAAIVAMVMATGCARGTRLLETWHDPGAAPLSLQRASTVFITNDESLRSVLQETVTAQVPSANVAYRTVSNANGEISDILRSSLDAGYSHAVVMRVVDVRNKTTYYAMDAVTDRIVTVETMIYTLANERLTFSARTETTNPSDSRALIESVMRRMSSTLERQGLLAERTSR